MDPNISADFQIHISVPLIKKTAHGGKRRTVRNHKVSMATVRKVTDNNCKNSGEIF